jgi:hypothetical protein
MTKEALNLALEALETPWNAPYVDGCDLALGKKVKAITAIKEALANEALDKMAENARELGLDYEPEQPKVRTGNCLRVGVCASEGHKIAPQRTWVGLTLGEQGDLYSEYSENPALLYKAIEAKLKEKNVPKD